MYFSLNRCCCRGLFFFLHLEVQHEFTEIELTFNMEIYYGYVMKFVLSCWGKIGKISVKNLISFTVSYYKVSTTDWTKKLLKWSLSETLSSPFLNYICSPNIWKAPLLCWHTFLLIMTVSKGELGNSQIFK